MLATVFIFTACKKDEPETLAGTSWGTQIEQTHSENGKTYPHTRTIDLNFSSSTAGAVVVNSVTLPDNITLGAITVPFTYTYNSSNSEGAVTFMPNGETGTFTINGETLKMNSEIQSGISINLDFTKK